MLPFSMVPTEVHSNRVLRPAERAISQSACTLSNAVITAQVGPIGVPLQGECLPVARKMHIVEPVVAELEEQFAVVVLRFHQRRVARGVVRRAIDAGDIRRESRPNCRDCGRRRSRLPPRDRENPRSGCCWKKSADPCLQRAGSCADAGVEQRDASASRCPTAALLPMQPWRPPHGESLLRLVHFATLAHGARRGRVRADAEVEQRDVLTRRPLSQCLRERASGQTRPCVVLRLVRSGSQLGRCRDSRVDLSRRLGIRTRSALGSVAPTVVVST